MFDTAGEPSFSEKCLPTYELFKQGKEDAIPTSPEKRRFSDVHSPLFGFASSIMFRYEPSSFGFFNTLSGYMIPTVELAL
jgi:hypothetical protein